MTKERFQIYTDDEDLKNYLRSKKKITEEIEMVLLKYLKGDLVDAKEVLTSKTLDNDYKQLRNKHLGIKIQLDQKRLDHWNVFDKSPSNQAETAIKKSVETRNLTPTEYENVTKYITLRKDYGNDSLWVAKCDLCKEGANYDSHKEALDDMVRHLTQEHSKKVMVMNK